MVCAFKTGILGDGRDRAGKRQAKGSLEELSW